jgi:hypothetical protein
MALASPFAVGRMAVVAKLPQPSPELFLLGDTRLGREPGVKQT